VKQLRDLLTNEQLERITSHTWDNHGRIYVEDQMYCPFGYALKGTTIPHQCRDVPPVPGARIVARALKLVSTSTFPTLTPEVSTIRRFMTIVDEGFPVNRALQLPVVVHGAPACCDVCIEFHEWDKAKWELSKTS
jgi:hypothetical protein